MSLPTVRYQSRDEDSNRWLGFVYRPGDLVFSTSEHVEAVPGEDVGDVVLMAVAIRGSARR